VFALKAYIISLVTVSRKDSLEATGDPMKTQHFGQHLTQLTQTFPFPINAYFVEETDGLTLIDSGIGGNTKNILEAAHELQLPIRRIALTHAHGDHVGSLDTLHAALPDAEVLISAREAPLLAGRRTLLPGEPQQPLRGSYQTCKTLPTRLLRDGDTVGSLRVVAAPGHTPGHIALFDPRDGTLVAGDAFTIQGGLTVSGTLRLAFPWAAIATWDRRTAIESAKRLRALNPTRLAVGHGSALEQPGKAMDRAILEAERNLK
jgi:glyoxylase-like metal-dependent hydrolase (beta-lactamase superfamily II)